VINTATLETELNLLYVKFKTDSGDLSNRLKFIEETSSIVNYSLDLCGQVGYPFVVIGNPTTVVIWTKDELHSNGNNYLCQHIYLRDNQT
jgi:hypothetical protein